MGGGGTIFTVNYLVTIPPLLSVAVTLNVIVPVGNPVVGLNLKVAVSVPT